MRQYLDTSRHYCSQQSINIIVVAFFLQLCQSVWIKTNVTSGDESGRLLFVYSIPAVQPTPPLVDCLCSHINWLSITGDLESVLHALISILVPPCTFEQWGCTSLPSLMVAPLLNTTQNWREWLFSSQTHITLKLAYYPLLHRIQSKVLHSDKDYQLF